MRNQDGCDTMQDDGRLWLGQTLDLVGHGCRDEAEYAQRSRNNVYGRHMHPQKQLFIDRAQRDRSQGEAMGFSIDWICNSQGNNVGDVQEDYYSENLDESGDLTKSGKKLPNNIFLSIYSFEDENLLDEKVISKDYIFEQNSIEIGKDSLSVGTMNVSDTNLLNNSISNSEETKNFNYYIHKDTNNYNKISGHIKLFIIDENYRVDHMKNRYGRNLVSNIIAEHPKLPGRKRHQISWNQDQLSDTILSTLNNLRNNIQRKDASSISAGALIKRIPDVLLKKMHKVSAYKKNFTTTIDSYLVTYTEGYAKLFEVSSSKLSVEDFIWFISIKFPDIGSDQLSQEFIEKVRKFIAGRNKHAHKDLKPQCSDNPVFRQILIKTKDKYYSKIHLSIKNKYDELYNIFGSQSFDDSNH